jgi:hypothetical protein
MFHFVGLFHIHLRFSQLKTLAVVLKNLIDGSKGGLSGAAGLKYRTLKLDNPKLGARLFCAAAVRELLLDPSLVGMAPSEAALTMEEAPSPAIRDAIGLKVLPAVSTAQREITAKLETGSAPKKAKLAEHNGTSTTTPTSSTTTTTTTTTTFCTEKLSEKQKARRMMEEKRLLEKEREKAFRKETRAKIAADKLVRQKDENWRPSVSAAADKTGTGLLTFRDRHGE